MKTISLAILLLVTLACGREESKSDASQAIGAENVDQAMLVDKKDGLPECNEGLYRQLAYVNEIDEFYTCNGKDWKAITIQGKDGTEGKDGAAGKDGKDGTDGLDGTNGKVGQDGSAGKDGKDGKDAKALSTTEWEHPLTGTLWFLTGQYFNQRQASACPSGSRFPTEEEWQSAFGAGITNKLAESLNINQRAWISETIYVQLYIGSTALDVLGGEAARDPNSSVASLNYRALCIKE